MMQALKTWIRWQDRLSEIFGRMVAVAGLVLVAIIGYEIIARQLLREPTGWAHEASTLLFGMYAILAGIYTEKWRGHVRIDILSRLLPERVRAGLAVVLGLAAVGVLIIVLAGTVEYAWASWEIGERSYKSAWSPPIWPVKATIPLAILGIMLQMLANIARELCVALDSPMAEETAADERQRG